MLIRRNVMINMDLMILLKDLVAELDLKASVKDSKVKFAWSLDGKKYQDCGDEFQMKEGKWIGAKFGFVAVETDPRCDRGWIDADWIRITK